jgi:hypothetical protein
MRSAPPLSPYMRACKGRDGAEGDWLVIARLISAPSRPYYNVLCAKLGYNLHQLTRNLLHSKHWPE